MLLIDRSLINYASLLASSAPAPGGGSAAALAGALGASLTNMTCALTEGRAKYAEHADLVAELLERLTPLREGFLALVDEDAQAYAAVSGAYKLPKETAAEKAARKAAVQSALKTCAQTPYELMELSLEALELTARAVGKTNKTVASDLGVAALCLKAAAQSAWLNVAANLDGIDDAGFTGDFREKCAKILDRALPLADSVYEAVSGI